VVSLGISLFRGTALPDHLRYPVLAITAGLFVALGNLVAAKADVIYNWETLSAMIDGAPAYGLTALGAIDLTDAAVAAGAASITSNPDVSPPEEISDGVVAAAFGFSIGPIIATPTGVINFTATPDGQYLHVIPENLYGGFFVNAGDTDAYFGIANVGSDVLTIGYGTDNAGSPCFGPQIPVLSHCVVTGVFETSQISEPSAFAVFGALCVIGLAAAQRRSSMGRVRRRVPRP
jgi:hypothetical protein